MPRPVTLFTGQWADLPLETLARMAGKEGGYGYDGLELACWGAPPHFDVQQAVGPNGAAYCRGRHDLLAKQGMRVWAVSNHLVGQCVCDRIDHRHTSIIPARLWGDGEPEGVRKRCAQEMIDTARAAARLGVTVVNGFTGSSIWQNLYFFPPTSQQDVDAGFNDFAERWGPILDVFAKEGVRFALEVHPSEIAYDIHTSRRVIEAVRGHTSFGFNFDPSHLHWQFVDPVAFIRAFPDRIYHSHVKDAARTLGGEAGILGSHLSFGDPRRGWDFRSPGRGGVDFESIIRALNDARYAGPLSVEWEDSAMAREHGAAEACAFVRKLDFPTSDRAFDSAFEKKS